MNGNVQSRCIYMDVLPTASLSVWRWGRSLDPIVVSHVVGTDNDQRQGQEDHTVDGDSRQLLTQARRRSAGVVTRLSSAVHYE